MRDHPAPLHQSLSSWKRSGVWYLREREKTGLFASNPGVANSSHSDWWISTHVESTEKKSGWTSNELVTSDMRVGRGSDNQLVTHLTTLLYSSATQIHITFKSTYKQTHYTVDVYYFCLPRIHSFSFGKMIQPQPQQSKQHKTMKHKHTYTHPYLSFSYGEVSLSCSLSHIPSPHPTAIGMWPGLTNHRSKLPTSASVTGSGMSIWLKVDQWEWALKWSLPSAWLSWLAVKLELLMAVSVTTGEHLGLNETNLV